MLNRWLRVSGRSPTFRIILSSTQNTHSFYRPESQLSSTQNTRPESQHRSTSQTSMVALRGTRSSKGPTPSVLDVVRVCIGSLSQNPNTFILPVNHHEKKKNISLYFDKKNTPPPEEHLLLLLFFPSFSLSSCLSSALPPPYRVAPPTDR